jgi:hypothetical protein
MRGPADDTHPEAERVLIALLREAPPWRKFELMMSLNRMARALAMNGLRQRHPEAGEAELRRRLAALLYGEELAEKAYGPLPSSGPDDD